jgi:aspartyl-tRNA(Asn)/glutamyl-tRNA(Gln) amidotransferase subunit C
MPSPPKIDRALIDHVAKLSSLRLSDHEASVLAGELSAIVAYVEQLGELDTSLVAPTTSVKVDHSALRPDEVEPGLTHEDALGQAPRATEDGFAVPGFVDNG